MIDFALFVQTLVFGFLVLTRPINLNLPSCHQEVAGGISEVDKNGLEFLDASAVTWASKLRFSADLYYGYHTFIGDAGLTEPVQTKIGNIACLDGALRISVIGKRSSSHVPFEYFFRDRRELSYVPAHLMLLRGAGSIVPFSNVDESMQLDLNEQSAGAMYSGVFDISYSGQENRNFRQLATCPNSVLLCGAFFGSNLENGFYLPRNSYRFYSGKEDLPDYKLELEVIQRENEIIVCQRAVGPSNSSRTLNFDLQYEYPLLRRIEIGDIGKKPTIVVALSDFGLVSGCHVPLCLAISRYDRTSKETFVETIRLGNIVDETPCIDKFTLDIGNSTFSADQNELVAFKAAESNFIKYCALDATLGDNISPSISTNGLELQDDDSEENFNDAEKLRPGWIYLLLFSFACIAAGLLLIRTAKRNH